MGLLDSILGKALGGQGSAAPNPQSMLESVLALLNNKQVGGLAGLMKIFQDKGLGNLVSGWVSTGPNPPVTSSQLSSALGPDIIGQFAQKLGLPQDVAAGHLAQLLPHVVDQMTPDGKVPDEHSSGINLDSALSMLKSKFFGG